MINSVILFIRDTLPIFLLLSLLMAQTEAKPRQCFMGLAAGLILAMLLYANLAYLSMLFDGAGLELTKAFISLLALISLCHFVAVRLGCGGGAGKSVFVLLAGVTVTNAIHFLIYFISFWSNAPSGVSLVMGSVIGIGISLSLCVLLYTAVSSISSTAVKLLFLAIFCAGQFAGVTTWLEQINILTYSQRVWDSTWLVADGSEYGHLLNALVGYEATPTKAYLIVYVCALVLPFICGAALKHTLGAKCSEESA